MGRGARRRRMAVSTHSRLKAAGRHYDGVMRDIVGFNTQPPEGGWQRKSRKRACKHCFNTQPPEGGWGTGGEAAAQGQVSTHSRLKAAGRMCRQLTAGSGCFNTQPPEGGWVDTAVRSFEGEGVSTHSRLKAAGTFIVVIFDGNHVSTHSRLKAAGRTGFFAKGMVPWFQHTAA